MCDSTYVRSPEEANSQTQKVEPWSPGTGGGGGELVFTEHRILVWEEEKVLEMNGDGCTAAWT